mmetsp:Transcript_7436/g.12809  ORF Transcript_7436/g.12809 Transcript_7436/m.12809 type:complete len:250 (+) Transcript_7436:269-1018(+)
MLRLMGQFRKTSSSLVEIRSSLQIHRRGILATLCREAHGLQDLVAVRIRGIQLQVWGHVDQSTTAIPAIVLEAHRDITEQLETLRGLHLKLLSDVEAIHQIVQDRASLARDLLVAAAVFQGMQELEIWCGITVGVVRVESDGPGGVRQISLGGSQGSIRLRADVEEGTPFSLTQGAQVLTEFDDYPVLLRHTLHQSSPQNQQVASQLQAGLLVVQNLGVVVVVQLEISRPYHRLWAFVGHGLNRVVPEI